MLKSIYIIGDNNGNYKIGISENTKGRMDSISTCNPYAITLIYESKKISNASKIEKQLHKNYEKFNQKNEWFKFSDINSIISFVNQYVESHGFVEEKDQNREEKFLRFIKQIKQSIADKCENEIKKIESSINTLKQENKNNYHFLQYIQGHIDIDDSVYAKMIYKTIFGKSFNELKQEYNIKGKESLRDYLTSEQLKEIEHMEMLVSSLIGLGMGYQEIKEFIKSKYVPDLTLIAN